MTPTTRLTAALAAWRPDLPRWQQQGAFNELRNATAAMEAAVLAAADRLEAQWAWMDEHPDDPAYAEWEEGWRALNAKYEAAWRLLEEATARVKEAGV